MIKKCYIFTKSAAVIRAIARLCERIPCFIDTKEIDENHFEFYVSCRAEDIRTVEVALARYV